MYLVCDIAIIICCSAGIRDSSLCGLIRLFCYHYAVCVFSIPYHNVDKCSSVFVSRHFSMHVSFCFSYMGIWGMYFCPFFVVVVRIIFAVCCICCMFIFVETYNEAQCIFFASFS